jgi:hypothetical protein
VNGDGYADVIVGAFGYDAGESDEGAAFVFLGGPAGTVDGNPSTADAQLEADQANAYLGTSVSGAGDVNGDGYADVIVGAPDYDAGHTDEGAALVFLGSPAGLADGNPATADAQLEADQAYSWLGTSVSGAGDVNGDGYADVIAGATYYDSGKTDEGAALVFLGGAAGVSSGGPATADARLVARQMDAHLGWSVSDAGDVNGDGYADVIAGATYYDSGKTDEALGRVVRTRPLQVRDLGDAPDGSQPGEARGGDLPAGCALRRPELRPSPLADLGRRDGDWRWRAPQRDPLGPHGRAPLPLAGPRSLRAVRRHRGRNHAAAEPGARPLAARVGAGGGSGRAHGSGAGVGVDALHGHRFPGADRPAEDARRRTSSIVHFNASR